MDNLEDNFDIEFNIYKTKEKTLNYNLSKESNMIIFSESQIILDKIIKNVLFESYSNYNQIEFIIFSERFEFYSDIKYHKYLNNQIVTDRKELNRVLQNISITIDQRYDLLREELSFEIFEYNQWIINENSVKEKMPYIILLFDNFYVNDFESNKVIDDNILRVIQKGRATGVHMFILVNDTLQLSETKYWKFISEKITI